MDNIPSNDILFFTREVDALDNFAALQIEIWGRMFPTVEHAYQWKKFSSSHPEVAEYIAEARNPWEAKERSSEHTSKLEGWHEQRLGIMEEILRAKAVQHSLVRDILLMSGNKTLIENAPQDTFWGIGSGGAGENHMGKLWMKIRSELQTA